MIAVHEGIPDLVPDGCSTGLEERDYSQYPVGYLVCAKPFDMPLMSDDEIEAAIRREKSDGCLLEKLAHEMPILDQDGYGACWNHSVVMAVQLTFAMNGQPFEPLSAFAGFALINGYRNRGGWCNKGLEFAAEVGVPTQKFWPQHSMSRSNDTPEMRANAALRRIAEWMDLDPQNMKRQHATCLLNGIPVPSDRMQWRHSTCDVRVLSWKPYVTVTKNSWLNWGDNGLGRIEGQMSVPHGACAPRVGGVVGRGN